VAFGAFSERCALDTARYGPVERDRLNDQARKAYQQALQIDPVNLEALSALSRLYVRIDDHDKAVATYQRAVQAHPKRTELWYELGMCHAQKKEWDLALTHIQKAVELDPENRMYARSFGFCLARAGRIDESVAVFARFDGEATAHYSVARMLHHMSQDEASKEHLRRAIAQAPDLTAARQLLASLERGTSDPQGVPAGLEGPEILTLPPQAR
jgi:tetratricopeptide (TPR) repeat protein